MKARFTAGPILTFTCSDWLSSQKVPIQLTLADIYPGMRQPGRQANHSNPFGAQVKNA